VASGGTLVAVAAGVCLGAAYANLGKQGADYANDLGQHNWNPVDTAADGWAPYQNAIDTNRYDKLGQMTTGTAMTWGGDALLIYGGIKGVQGASGGGGCSFRADTAVVTTAGAVAIAGLKVGDTVAAYDPRTGETGPHTVSAVMVNTDPVVEHLALDSGSIETTPNHPFFTADRGWVLAGDLLVGEQIRTESGQDATVVSFTLDATPASMWDLTVDGAHSFFVGSGAVLVHNCPGGGGGAKNFWSAENSINRAASKFGVDRTKLGNYVHEMKDDMGLGGADNLEINPANGDIYLPGGVEVIGNVHDVK
jgi:Pretoxin HINT domain